MTWRRRAARIIEGVLAALPKDASDKVKRAAISNAYPWGERKYHPYKEWCKAVKDAIGPSRKTAARPNWTVMFTEESVLFWCCICKNAYVGGCLECRKARAVFDALTGEQKSEWSALYGAATKDGDAAMILADWEAEHWGVS